MALTDTRGRTLRKLANKAARRNLSEARREYVRQKEISLHHDFVMDACASVFVKGSALSKRTGYAFLSCEPLLEIQAKGFDLWLHNLDDGSAIFVECKGSVSKPEHELREVSKSIESIQSNRDRLERIVAQPLRSIEYVLCVPTTSIQRVAESLGEIEARGETIGDGKTRLLLWALHEYKGEKIQFFGLVPNRPRLIDCRHRNNELQRALRDPVRADSALLNVRAYPSSHISRISSHVIEEVLRRNQEEGRDPEILPVDEVKAFFANKANLVHYAAPELSEPLTRRFLTAGVSAGLLEPIRGNGSESFRITARGTQIPTRLGDYGSRLDKSEILQLSHRWAYEEVVRSETKGSPTLDKWNPSGSAPP
jgi:hypothetical protein